MVKITSCQFFQELVFSAFFPIWREGDTIRKKHPLSWRTIQKFAHGITSQSIIMQMIVLKERKNNGH